MRLKELRNSRNLSQKELADKLGYKQGTISQWEMGRRSLDIDTLLRLSEFYGVSTDYILGRSAKSGTLTDPLQNKLLGMFNNLNDIGKLEAIKRVSELSQLKKYQSEKMPIAAHNDTVGDDELKLMQEDIDEL